MTTIAMRQATRRDGRIAYCVGYGDRPTLRNPMPDREHRVQGRGLQADPGARQD